MEGASSYLDEIYKTQDLGILKAKEECIKKYGIEVLNSSTAPYVDPQNVLHCPSYFDQIICWPPTVANTLASMSCRNGAHTIGFSQHLRDNSATRNCTADGSWLKLNNELWANYTPCYQIETTIIRNHNLPNTSIISEMSYYPTLKTISEIGYGVSFTTLLIAILIMMSIKKLHCSRNILHMHLFASFIMRSFIYLLKDVIFVEGVGFGSDVINQNGTSYFHIKPDTYNWQCKLMTSLWQYFTMANYSWILMEGLYLHNLIFNALFADTNRNVIKYIIMGWGFPLLAIIPWITMRLFYDDTLCWTITINHQINLLIMIPIMASNVVNLVFFVQISFVLFVKLNSQLNEESKRYKKWAKSTLVLVPLFGVNYTLLLALQYTNNDSIKNFWLFADRLFGSFQGFFVSILYCFLNGEVKAELKPHIHQFLTFFATNKYLGLCFPCRTQFLRYKVRTSVCTTLSCSSLNAYRNNKCRCEVSVRHKHLNCTDKCIEIHICQNGLRCSNDSILCEKPNFPLSKASHHSTACNYFGKDVNIPPKMETHLTENAEKPAELSRMLPPNV